MNRQKDGSVAPAIFKFSRQFKNAGKIPVLPGVGEINLEKKEGFVVRHESEIRDVKVRIVDCVNVMIQIEEEKAMSSGMRRQNIGPKGDGVKRRRHLHPIFAVAGT